MKKTKLVKIPVLFFVHKNKSFSLRHVSIPRYNREMEDSQEYNSGIPNPAEQAQNELQHELEAPATLEYIKKNLGNYIGIERRTLKPHHDVLDEQKERRQTPPSPPKANIMAHTANPDALQATIIATLNDKPLSEEEIVRVIVRERGLGIDLTAPVVKNIAMRVHNALANPLVAKRLMRNNDGTLGLATTNLVAGGSDRSQQKFPKTTIKDTLAQGAVWVEDQINKGNVDGVDLSGEGFLAQLGTDKPRMTPESQVEERKVPEGINDRENYSRSNKIDNALTMRLYPEAEIAESPVRKIFLTRLGDLIEKTKNSIEKKKIKVFSEFKAAHGKFEDILQNLPSIEGFVPSAEYDLLVKMAEQGAREERAESGEISQQTVPEEAVSKFPPQTPKVSPTPRELIPSNSTPIYLSVAELDRRAEKQRIEKELAEAAKPQVLEEANNRGAFVIPSGTRESSPEKDPKTLIAEAQTFDELFEVLRQIGTIQGSSKMYDAEYLIKTIEGLRRGELLHNLRDITGTYGLRGKVDELLSYEKSINLPEPPPVYEPAVEPPPFYVETPESTEGQVATEHIDPASPVKEKTFNERMRDARRSAQPYYMSKKSFSETYRHNQTEGPTRKEDLSPEVSEEIERILREELAAARGTFVVHEAAYKREVREKKSKYRRILEDLGAAEKQLPEMPPKDAQYREAERAYLKAQWDLKNFIVGRDVKEVEFSYPDVVLSNNENKKIDVGVANEMQKEWVTLQREIQKNIPEKEKGRIAIAFEKWNSLSLPKRIAISTVLLTVGSATLGGVGISAAFATGAMRFGRSLAGAGIGIGAGKVFDGVVIKKKIEKIRNERLDEVGSVDTRKDEQAFIDQVKDFADKATAEEKTKRKYQLVKGGVMAATSGIATIGINAGTQAVVDNLNTPKSSWFDKLVKKEVLVEQPVAPKPSVMVEEVPETPTQTYMDSAEVELSNKGFIDSLDKLKHAVEGKKLTPEVERLFTQSPSKIAMDLGLYKPGQAAESAFGFQHEKLAIDTEGNISLVHNGGETEILMNSNGTLKPYAGRMFDADKLATSPMPEVTGAPRAAVVLEQSVVPKAPVVEIAKSVPESAMPNARIEASVSADTMAADVVATTSGIIEQTPVKSIDFKDIVSGDVEHASPQSIISGELPLKSDYQFDPKFKNIRTAYNIELEKKLMNVSPDMFDLRYPIEYNGGRINVFQKDNNLTFFLNGQKIGTGSIVDEGIGFQYDRSLGTSMFGSKNGFEQAFDAARQAVEKNKMFFKVKK